MNDHLPLLLDKIADLRNDMSKVCFSPPFAPFCVVSLSLTEKNFFSPSKIATYFLSGIFNISNIFFVLS